MKFIIYSRKSRTAQDGHTQHTHKTSEWHINTYLKLLDKQGVKYEVVASYEEDLSGGGYYTKRPIFNKIVEQCKSDKDLVLLVAKADRMTRNVRTGAELMETINFILANAPDADDMQKHLEFVIAEREYKNTSQRYKDMYQAKKARCEASGEKLEWGASSKKYQEKLHNGEIDHVSCKRRRSSTEHFESIRGVFTNVIDLMRQKRLQENKMTLRNIRDNLTMLNVAPASGTWNPRKVSLAMDYYGFER